MFLSNMVTVGHRMDFHSVQGSHPAKKRYQNRTDRPNVEQQPAVSAINKSDFASTQIDHLIALKLQKEKEQSIYLLARPDVGFGCPWASSGGRIPGRLHKIGRAHV